MFKHKDWKYAAMYVRQFAWRAFTGCDGLIQAPTHLLLAIGPHKILYLVY